MPQGPQTRLFAIWFLCCSLNILLGDGYKFRTNGSKVYYFSLSLSLSLDLSQCRAMCGVFEFSVLLFGITIRFFFLFVLVYGCVSPRSLGANVVFNRLLGRLTSTFLFTYRRSRAFIFHISVMFSSSNASKCVTLATPFLIRCLRSVPFRLRLRTATMIARFAGKSNVPTTFPIRSRSRPVVSAVVVCVVAVSVFSLLFSRKPPRRLL